MNLVTEIYKEARSFPPQEKYGLASQIQRAAVSIPSNIAEGHGRKSTKIYMTHLSIAHGSLMELETQLEIAYRLGYVDAKIKGNLSKLTAEIGRMLNALQEALRSKTRPLNPES